MKDYSSFGMNFMLDVETIIFSIIVVIIVALFWYVSYLLDIEDIEQKDI